MACNDFRNERDALLRWHIRQSDEAGVRETMQVDEFAEIGVYGNHHPVFSSGTVQKRPVTGVRAKFPGIKNIVPL